MHEVGAINCVCACPKMILTNQIAGFFKLKYRKNQLDFEIDFFFQVGRIFIN